MVFYLLEFMCFLGRQQPCALALAKTYGCTVDRLEAIVWLVQVQRTLFYGKQQKRNGVDLGDTWFEIPSDLSGKHSQHIFAQWLRLARKVVHDGLTGPGVTAAF